MFSVRSLILIEVVWLIVYVVIRLRARPLAAKSSGALATKMARCRYCGLYVPETEAVTIKHRSYCSNEHKDRDTGS